MTPLYTASQMRELDRITIEEIQIPGVVLMEHAGHMSAVIIMNDFPAQKIAIVCGKGNNGGDGYVIARWLSLWGKKVQVFALTPVEELKGDALINASIFKRLFPERLEVVEDPQGLAERLKSFDLVVDAIFGTGLTRPASGIYATAIEQINLSGCPVFAVDIPSGLPSDTGEVIGPTVKATATATYGGIKCAQMIYPAREYVGRLYVVDIGIPHQAEERVHPFCFLPEEEDIIPVFTKRPPTAHKGTYGHLAVICGSPGKTGAGIMAGEAALRVGTGLVTLFVPEELNPIYEASTLEVMSLPLPSCNGHISSKAVDKALTELENKDALAIGPGLGQHPETLTFLEKILEQIETPVVIDADGINLLAKKPEILKKTRAPVILTPHPGEFARLTGVPAREANARRLKTATEYAEKLGAIIVLKGASTITALPDGTAYINPTGNPSMATGGSGDVLTGIIGGLLAMGLSPQEATYKGVFLHGLCGDAMVEEIGEYPLTASDLIEGLIRIISFWEKGEKVWTGCYEAL